MTRAIIDDKFIACAIAGQAEYIVSGDADLLELKNYRSVKIVNARIFLGMIGISLDNAFDEDDDKFLS